MDGETFDRLSQRFSRGRSRRMLVGLLAALPLAAALTPFQEVTEAAKNDRGQKPPKRHRRHKRQERNKRRNKQRQRKHECRPESVEKLCAGKCSLVTNKCGKQVDCGPCSCATGCPRCQTCDTATGLCVADESQNRSVCAGDAGATSVCCQGECCDGCCGADGTCGACLAFVTSTTHNGNLGGLTGADAICQARAAAGGLPGGAESGTYKAWLSDATGSPSSRFRCTEASCSEQGYTRVDDAPIASDWGTLTDGTLEFAISVTELNTYLRPFDSGVWTNTLTTGEAGPFPTHCTNWSTGTSGIGYAGDATAFDAWWTDTNGGAACGAPFHLYCFQQS